MRKILFICYGNICRSPTAEFLFNETVGRRGLSSRFLGESAAVADDNIYPDGSGGGVYPVCKRMLAERGIDCSGKQARLLKKADYDGYELFFVMDKQNLRAAHKIFGGDPQDKLKLLTEYTSGGEIEDPWYTRNFDKVFAQIEEAVNALLDKLNQ